MYIHECTADCQCVCVSASGHATSYSARIDGIVLSVTKNNVSG